jgi:hypothetical protein
MSPTRRRTASAKAESDLTTCPWCSAAVPAASATCPSCGASLQGAADAELPGVTQVDPAAVSRLSRVKPGRIASWLGAESTADTPDLGGRVEPPSKEVREEMLRLELAALDAELAAKASQAAAERELPSDEAAEPNPG